MHQVRYGRGGQARGLRWMTSPRRRPTEVLLDITAEGGVSFRVSTHLGRDETVGKVDGTLEVLTIPVSTSTGPRRSANAWWRAAGVVVPSTASTSSS